jgi:hypothetical protein
VVDPRGGLARGEGCLGLPPGPLMDPQRGSV